MTDIVAVNGYIDEYEYEKSLDVYSVTFKEENVIFMANITNSKKTYNNSVKKKR